MVRRTDERNSQAEALVGLAEVLELSGCDEDAIVAVEEASELFQMKGNVVGAAEALSIEQRVRAKSGRDPSVVIDITDGVPNRDIDRAARNMS